MASLKSVFLSSLLSNALSAAVLTGLPMTAQAIAVPAITPPTAAPTQRIQINMYLGRSPRSNAASRVAEQFKKQKPGELDAPLQITLVRWLWDDERTRLDGLVMEFGVEADGLPGHVRMMQVPLGSRKFGKDELNPELRLALVGLIQSWRFKPPLKDGKPVSFCCVRLISQPE
jgi:hypothetical protein